MHEQGFTRDAESHNYQLTYISSPGKSYVIEPHRGQLHYNLVDRNPEKFYDQVFNQNISQTKVKNVHHRNMVEISTKVTKRPYMKIMEKIRSKIADRIRDKFGAHEGELILDALKEKHIEHQIIMLLRQDKIQLLNQHNEPVYVKQIQDALDHHEKVDRGTAHMMGPNDVSYNAGMSEAEGEHLRPESPTSHSQISRSKLVRKLLFIKMLFFVQEMQDHDLRRIETEVRDHIVRSSSKK